MAKKRNALGRGLKSLLDDRDPSLLVDGNPKQDIESEEVNQIIGETIGVIVRVPLDQIEVNPFQPRTEFDNNKLKELSDSILIHGVIQPITVRKLENNNYQLIVGERRLRASKMAGLEAIPTYVRAANDQESLELALIENIHREDLNALEIAINYKRLIDECNLTQDTLATRLGKNRTTVTNYLRLLKLVPEIQLAIKSNVITMGHARAIISIEDPVLQYSIFKEIIKKHYSVRQVEALVRKWQSQKSKSKKNDGVEKIDNFAMDLHYKKVKESLTSYLDAKVVLKVKGKGSGELIVLFRSTDDLNRILGLIDKA